MASHAVGPRRTAVFILSADHSGSTWVGYVLGSHPHSAFLGEYYRAWRPELRQPCTACAAAGLAECTLLHGLDQVPSRDAFRWAFERTGKRILVDSSKVIDWAGAFAEAAAEFDIRLIHLIRDPRGWFASRRRRSPGLGHADFVRLWLAPNIMIQRFVKLRSLTSAVVVYDDLADQPMSSFPKLFEFCGMEFTPASLQYWNFQHHGFAANGATSAILPGNMRRADVPHFMTRDDSFYETHNQTLFADRRWTVEVSAEDSHALSSDPGVKRFLRSIGKKLTTSGVADTAMTAPRRLLGRMYPPSRNS